jgi:N6-adenosine-specific RNA methylase IME4
MSYLPHEYAGLFPMLGEAELNALAADIKSRGLRQRITLYQGKILDGRSRYEACARTGVDPVFVTYDGDDPLGEVVSLNVKRRHLNESQRAMAAAKLATLRQGARTDLAQICAKSQDEAAELLNVSRRSVQHATTVRDQGTHNLQGAVESGKIAVSLAAKISAADADTQDAVVKRVQGGAKPLEAYRIEKAAKIHEHLLRNPTGKFRVIYADAPWSYGEHGNQPGSQSRERDHYPVMELSEICALPVKDWAEENAVLLLWTPSPMLKKAFEVIEAWGFEYKASFVWDKVDHNMGHYNSVRHEFLLVCTKGQCQPDVRKLFDSVVSERRTTHSRKPTVFYDIIETLYPNGRRLEMFCRGDGREGWETYGLETSEQQAAAA